MSYHFISWELFQLSYSLETSHISFLSSDVASLRVLGRFEVILEETVLSFICSNQEVCIQRERVSHTTKDISWASVLLGLHLGEDFGSLDLSLSCILEALSAIHSILLYVFHICSILYEDNYISK